MTAATAVKIELYESGIKLANEFLAHNGIDEPTYRRVAASTDSGYYETDKRRVSVCLIRCMMPAYKPGYSWSMMGYKADRTPFGVVTHEVGHHIHNLKRIRKSFTDDWDQEPKVSGYAPDVWYEAMAEALRMFICNPNMLRIGRPRRWRAITADVGLRPLHDTPWDEVLESYGAGDKYLNAARNWVASGQRRETNG